MVFYDLSAPQTLPHSNNKKTTPIASVSDRFIALVLDFLIFSPVVSLVVAGLVRQAKTYFLLNADSQEGIVAAFLVVVAIFFLTCILQSAFLYYWQATPGQFFLQLRVISYPQEQKRLSLNQCLIRSVMWCSGFILLAVPFIEVASHPLRRAFHERASDTVVITLKQDHDEGPLPIESRFLASWMRMSFLFLLLIAVVGFFKTYRSLLAGEYKETNAKNFAQCKEIKDVDVVGSSRLDAALALFMLNEVSPECLVKEADAALWNSPAESNDLAYLAKYVTTEGEQQQKYLDKVCEDLRSATCSLARYLQEDGKKEDLEDADANLWTTQLLLADEKFTTQDYVGSLKIIDSLQKISVLKGPLEKRFVRAVWALNESRGTKNRGRMPASQDGETWIENFKEKYEVP